MQIVEVLIEYANRSLNRPFSYLYKPRPAISGKPRQVRNFRQNPL